jgi:RluA family pseudouridine synthase
MAKSPFIQLGDGAEIPILHEDRGVLAIDKPAGWLLVPTHWDRTARNLQLAIDSAIRGGEFWAKSRNLRFLRYVHRLDADTSGILLFSKSAGGVPVYSKLFESRQMEKSYLAVVEGLPKEDAWSVAAPIGTDTHDPGRMRVDQRGGKEAQTDFTVLERGESRALLLARPVTGRTHQIRVHLAHAGFPVADDPIYGQGGKPERREFPLGLRAVGLAYRDPFTRRDVRIRAAGEPFCRAYGFEKPKSTGFSV